MSRTYSRRTCKCGRELSANGLSWHNHMMGHVRKGEAKKVTVISGCLTPGHGDRYTTFEWAKQPTKIS